MCAGTSRRQRSPLHCAVTTHPQKYGKMANFKKNRIRPRNSSDEARNFPLPGARGSGASPAAGRPVPLGLRILLCACFLSIYYVLCPVLLGHRGGSGHTRQKRLGSHHPPWRRETAGQTQRPLGWVLGGRCWAGPRLSHPGASVSLRSEVGILETPVPGGLRPGWERTSVCQELSAARALGTSVTRPISRGWRSTPTSRPA